MITKETYLHLKEIVEPIHAHSDQLMAIAQWIDTDFTKKANPKQRFYFASNDLAALATKLQLDDKYNQLPDVCQEGETAEDKIIIDTMNKHFWYCNDDSYEFHVRIIANAFQETVKQYKPETQL